MKCLYSIKDDCHICHLFSFTESGQYERPQSIVLVFTQSKSLIFKGPQGDNNL